MSTTVPTPVPAPREAPPRTSAPAPARPAGRVTLARVARSEWVKLRTLRSTWLLLLGAYAAMAGIGAIVGYNVGRNWATVAPEDSAISGGLQGFLMAQLLVGVLGVLFVTGEYGTGMIRSSLAAVPRRLPVLVAKALVYGTVALVAMVPATLAGWYSSQAFLSSYGHGTSLLADGALRVVLGTAGYLALVGLLGLAIGWVVRSTAGGISTYVGLMLVLPVVAGLLPGTLGDLGRFLPTIAGESFLVSVHLPGTLSPWTGFAVLVGWVVAALALAAVQLRRRDA